GTGNEHGIPGVSGKDRAQQVADQIRRNETNSPTPAPPGGKPGENAATSGGRLGSGTGNEHGIPGVSGKDRAQQVADQIRRNETNSAVPLPGKPSPARDGAGYGGKPATLNQTPVADHAAPAPSGGKPGTSSDVPGAPTGGRPGVSSDRPGGPSAGKPGGDAATSGGRLGSGTGNEHGIPGVSGTDRAQQVADQIRRNETNSAVPLPGKPSPARDGAGYGSKPATLNGTPAADHPTSGTPGGKPSGTPGGKPGTSSDKPGGPTGGKPGEDPFSKGGDRLGGGTGDEHGIPGVSGKDRAQQVADQIRRNENPSAGGAKTPPAPRPPRRTGKGYGNDPIGMSDIRDRGGAGSAGSKSPNTETRNGNGTFTILEQPKAGSESPHGGHTETDPRARNSAGSPSPSRDGGTTKEPATSHPGESGPIESTGGHGSTPAGTDHTPAGTDHTGNPPGTESPRPQDAATGISGTSEPNTAGTPHTESGTATTHDGGRSTTSPGWSAAGVTSGGSSPAAGSVPADGFARWLNPGSTSAHSTPAGSSPVQGADARADAGQAGGGLGDNAPTSDGTPGATPHTTAASDGTGIGATTGGATTSHDGAGTRTHNGSTTSGDTTTSHDGGTAGSSNDPARTDLESARRKLGKLSEAGYAQVMADAQAIVADLSGHVSSAHDNGGLLLPLDQVRLLVAAEIVRSGHEAGGNLARTLVPSTAMIGDGADTAVPTPVLRLRGHDPSADPVQEPGGHVPPATGTPGTTPLNVPEWVRPDRLSQWLAGLRLGAKRQTLAALNAARPAGGSLLYLGANDDIEHPLLASSAQSHVFVGVDPAVVGHPDERVLRNAHLTEVRNEITRKLHEYAQDGYQVHVESETGDYFHLSVTGPDGRSVYDVEYHALTYDEFVALNDGRRFDVVLDKDSWLLDWKDNQAAVAEQASSLTEPGGHWIGGFELPTPENGTALPGGFDDVTGQLGIERPTWSGYETLHVRAQVHTWTPQETSEPAWVPALRQMLSGIVNGPGDAEQYGNLLDLLVDDVLAYVDEDDTNAPTLAAQVIARHFADHGVTGPFTADLVEADLRARIGDGESTETPRTTEPPTAPGTPESETATVAGPIPPVDAVHEPRGTDVARTDVRGARRGLGELSQARYAQVMADAQAIVADLSGHVPSAHDNGGVLSPLDQVRLLVAAQIARSGHEAGGNLARTLVPITSMIGDGADTAAAPQVVAAVELPRGTVEQRLPGTSRDAYVVQGQTLPDGLVVVDGQAMTPEQLATWIGDQRAFGNSVEGRPVVLLASDAGIFAAVIAARLGRPVIAPWGGFVQLPSGRLMAGTAVRMQDGGVSLAATPADVWNVYAPDGEVAPLARELGAALDRLGVRLTVPAEVPAQVTVWGGGEGLPVSELGDLAKDPAIDWLPVFMGDTAQGQAGGPVEGGVTEAPPAPEPEPAPAGPAVARPRRPVYPVPEVDERRPVSLEETAPAVAEQIVWEDEARLPSYFFDEANPGLGHGDIGFRGQAEILAGLQSLRLPQATWDEIKVALVEEPASFLGDGRPFTVAPPKQEPYEIVIQARPRGNWDRFYDVNDETIRVDKQTAQTGNVTTDKMFGTSRHMSFAIPLGPGGTPGTGFGQLSIDMVGNERSYTYGYGTTGVDHREMRVSGGSHVHVDDLNFTVRTYRTDTGVRRQVNAPVQFVVRGGLQVRVPDRLTAPADTDLPRRFAFNGLVPDTYHVEQVGSVAPVFDRALEMFPGATIGSPAYQTLRQTLAPRGLTGGMGEMIEDWGVLQEVPGTGQGRPVGGLRLRAQLISAELLVAADGHEMRVGRFGGTRTEVTAATTNAFQLSGMAGGMGSFQGPMARGRIQAGLTGQASWNWRESAMSGGTASRKRLAVTSGTSGLYKVAVEYGMQRTGGEEVTVQGHVLLRLPESEAKRLAAGQGVAPAADQATQPAVPPYLTADQPSTLGLHGVRSLTGIQPLQERSIAALARQHPNLVAPWSELDPAHPRWAGHPGRYILALRNTIQLSRFLSATSIAPSMDTLISTGLRLPLRAYNKVRKEYVTVRLRADLRNRRFVGSESDIGMRNSSILTDRIDSARRTLYSASLGIGGSARAQDAAAIYTGSVAASWRYTWQRSRTSTFGQAVSGDDQVVAKGASHSFAYDIDFHLEVAGYSRPRNAYRAGTLDLLAMQYFVRTTPWRSVLDDGPATGTLTIRVPDALTSALAKPVPPPTRADAGIGQGADTRDWRKRGHAVVGVAGTKELNEAVQRQIAESQQDSWLFTQPGTTAHEIVQDGLTADAHNANFLRMATGGWGLGPLLAKRPVQDRIGTVEVTARVGRLRAVSGVISGMELELDRQGEMRAGHGASTAQGHGASMSASFGAKPTIKHTPVLGTYGPVWTIYERMRSQERSSSLTGVHDVNPNPSGRFVLVTGDVTYTVRAQGRRTGRVAPKWAVTTKERSTEVPVPEGVYMIVSEDDAEDMGLIPKAPGPEPDYGSVTVPREYLSTPLGWAPENTPDASEAVALLRDWFAEQAARLLPNEYAGLLPAEELEDLANNLKHLKSATSTLGMAGLLSQMVADGVPVRLLQGRGYLPWTNSARVSIRVELGEPEFLRAHHNHEIDEYPNSVEGEQSSQSVSRTRGGGFAITQSPFLDHSRVHHEDNTFTDAGALTRTDTHSKAKRSTGYRATVAAPRPTAKLAFPTTVILSVEQKGKAVHSVSAPGGPLVAQVPWTFTVPTERADAAMGAPLRSLRPGAPGLDRPLDLPDTAAIVNVGGVAAIRHAGTAAVAALKGAPDHRVGRTPLTQGGNVAGEMLANALSQPVLRTSFPRATKPGGQELPELSENFITGGATARLTVHAQADLGGGVLISVSNDHRWDIAARQVRSTTARGTRSDARSAALGSGPALATTGPALETGPAYQAGMSPAGRAWGESDAAGQSTQVGQAQRLLLKNEPKRTFVFRFPVDWRFTTTGTRATWSGAAAAVSRKGPLRPQTKELHVEKGVWIRLTESDARELGLITDENFPPVVSAEWDAVAAAGDAWKAADKTFRDTRDDMQAAHDSVEAARKDIAEAEATLAQSPGDAAALVAATDAQAALADAERKAAAAEEAMTVARTAAEETAARFRDLHASAVAMTTLHRTPAPAAERTGEEPPPLASQDPATQPESATSAGTTARRGPRARLMRTAQAPSLATIVEEDESGSLPRTSDETDSGSGHQAGGNLPPSPSAKTSPEKQTGSDTPESTPARSRPVASVDPERVTDVTADGIRYPVHRVRGDGDCFYTAVIQGASLQRVNGVETGDDIGALRERVAAHVEHGDDDLGGNLGDPVDAVADDVTGTMSEEALVAVLGLQSVPELTAAQWRQVEERLRNEQWRQFRRELASNLPPDDAETMRDLPLAALREMFPDLELPVLSGADGIRAAAIRTQRRTALMQLLHERLSGSDEQANAVWQRLLRGSHSAGLLQVAPTPARARELGTQALTAHAVRNTGLWQTRFYDAAPQATARALNVDIVVVTDDGVRRNTNPQATGGTLYVHYDGGTHYQTMGPGERLPDTARTTAAAPGEAPDPEQPPPARTSGPQAGDAARPAESGLLAELLTLAGRHGASDDYLDRLRGLSAEGRQTLESRAAPGRSSAAKRHTGGTATASAGPGAGGGARESAPQVMSAAELPPGTVEQRLPGTSRDAYVVRGQTLPDGRVVVDGQTMTPEQLATPAPGGKQVMLARGTKEIEEEFAATVAEFPEVVRNDRWTVWGQGAEEPDFRVFVAESPALGGLRGQYDPEGPKAGRVTDHTGRVYDRGPAWNWYLPGGGHLLASSRPATVVRSFETDALGVPISPPTLHPVSEVPAVDPSATAALRRLLDGGLPHAMRWRSEQGEAPLYKFSDKAPEAVFRDGLLPKGEQLVHLLDHVYNSPPDTAYVSTSRSVHYLRDSTYNDPGSAAALHGRYRWRYDVQVPGGIDVNATLDIASPFPDQQEVAFPGGIHPRYIVGAQPLVNGSPAGAYVHNPAFAPTAVTDSTAGEPAPDPVLRESASSSVPVGHSAVRSPAVSVSAGPEEVQREVREISEVIAGEFGIRLDSGAAVAAVEQSNPHVGEATLAKVRERRWDPNELRGLRAALEHFAPILGERRSRSGRAGAEQEVTHVGAVSFGVTNRKIDFGMAGEYIGSHKMLNFYAPVLIGKDFGGGRREIEGTATHELAHGLLKYALPEFTDAFGSWGPDGRPRLREGAEPPYGNATSAMADLEASIKASFLVPDKFAAESPKHAEAITALKGRHPGVFERKPGELSGKAAARIARELKSELPEFNKMVGSWTEDGWPTFEGELPITLYAATNANEDLSETAKYYFLEPETLRAKAPKRAAFFGRLVAEWNTSASETEPGVQPVSSSPDGRGNDLSAGKPPLVGEVHETGPAHPVAEEPTVSPATTAALPRLVDGGLPDAHSEPRQVEGLSQAQAVRLSRLTLRAVDMPTDGNCFFHALIRLAPAEVAAASGSTGVPPTPAQVRAHLADALAQDLGRPEGDRRLWPTVDGQALAALIDDGEVPQEGLTDRLRRDIIEALRTPGSYDNAAGDIAPVVAGQVFGLTIEVVLPDGSLYEVGDPDGHRIVVALVPREARGYDHWIAGVPIGAVSSRTGVRAGRGDVATGGVRAGLTASAPGHPGRPGRASSRERAAAPPAFFDAPRPVATEDDRPAQDTGAVVRRRQHGTGDGAIGSRPQLDRMPPALRDSGRESGF
ncbi:MAG: hypothetical protein JWR24_86, partial [Actinoallomurus sp.]|nr:hypothetical protein [Actinoallomurus sp.]